MFLRRRVMENEKRLESVIKGYKATAEYVTFIGGTNVGILNTMKELAQSIESLRDEMRSLRVAMELLKKQVEE